MLLYQATSNFSRCNFDGNSAAQSGALHAQAQSKAYIDDVMFNNNSATNFTGGAISTILGSILHIQGSQFYSNTAKTYGGSIFVSKNGTVELYNVEFDRNQVDVFGGAINIESNSSIQAVDCTFTRNFAKEKGAALTVTLKGSSASFTRCEFTDNFAELNAGAIYTVVDSSLNVDDCTFRNNTAMTGSGGAISVMVRSATSIANSTFLNNTSVFGSAVHFFGFAQGTIANCYFEKNTATLGTIYGNSNVSIVIRESNITSNTAKYGGAIKVEKNASLVVEDSEISKNSADMGAGIRANENTTVKLSGVVFTENNANYSSSNGTDTNVFDFQTDMDEIEQLRRSPTRELDELYKFNQLTYKLLRHAEVLMAQGYSIGGAMVVDGNCSVAMVKCRFERNRAKVAGVAWFVDNVNADIEDTHFVNNSARYFGGVFWLSHNTTVNLRQSNIAGNKAQIIGEFSLVIYQSGMTISDSSLRGNSHGAINGLLLSESSYVTLDNCDVRNHETFGVKGSFLQCAAGSKVTLESSHFENNDLDLVSTYDRCTTEVVNSTFKHNKRYGFQVTEGSTMTMINSSVEAQTSMVFVIRSYASVTIDKCLFSNSTFTGNNRLIFLDHLSNCSVTNSNIVRNHGNSDLLHVSSNSTMTISDSLVTMNTVDVLYLATVTEFSSLEFRQTSFTNNSIYHYGDKGVICTTSSKTAIIDSHFENNSAKRGAVVFLQDKGEFYAENSSFYGNVAEVGSVVNCNGPGSVYIKDQYFSTQQRIRLWWSHLWV